MATGSGTGTVAAAPTTYQLITLARARQISALVSLSDAALTILVEAASDSIQRKCNRLFLEETRTEVYDGRGGRILWLREFPVASLDTTEAVIITYSDDTTYTYTSSYFNFNARTGELWFKPAYFGDYFPTGFQNIAIKYTAGWQIADIPPMVQEATARLAHSFFNFETMDSSMQSERLGDYQYTKKADAGELPKAITHLLAPYINHEVRV